MIESKDLLSAEKKLLPSFSNLTVACVITGIFTYLFSEHSTWQQWSVLVHLFSGIAFSIIIVFYLVTHFHRTLGFRRASMLSSGLLLFLLCVAFIGSGWYIMLHGQQESKQWVYQLHIGSSIIFVLVVFLHLMMHVKLLPERRRKRGEIRFPSLPNNIVKSVIIFNLSTQVLIGLMTLIYDTSLKPYSNEPAVTDYQYPYGDNPFKPSQTEISQDGFIDKRQIDNSHRCTACHEDISNQWLASVHKQAASDPTYVKNISLLVSNKGINATRYCEGCHAPVALLTGELSPGGQHGGIAGTAANMEGVSCMSCHGVESLVHLKGVASFKFKPAKDYIFAKSENVFLLRIHDLILRMKPEQHKVDLAKPLLKDSKFCATCHSQFMDKEMNQWGWVSMQNEYAAWVESPFSKHHEENFSNINTSRCQDCHMPLIKSKDPSSNKEGMIRSHHFPGANTFLPLLNGDINQFEATKVFLQSNKLQISIDKPKRKDTSQTSSALDEYLRSFDEAPYHSYLGEENHIQVIVTNSGVGHNFPAGSIDLGEAWIEFLVMDAEGKQVYISGNIDSDNYVDESAYFYRSLPIDRNGKHVWKHDLFNMVGRSFKRVIKSGEADIVDYKFKTPSWAKSPLIITATLKYRKLNERYARWALGDSYINIPIIDMARDSLFVPLKISKEVE